jgi:beta-1,4-mannosyl-glycoprotein beta-1,4-N-acetylglucosaminyltransferase
MSVVSWLIVFIPFIFMTVIVTLLLYIFGLDASTGRLKLSSNNTKPIDKQTFVSFCMNHNLDAEEKDEYDIDDFLKLNLTEVEVNEPIGIENKSFIVNPFDNIFNYYDNAQSLSTSLLMNYNTKKIYICLAEDVYPYLESTGLELEHTINVYFPYLFSEKKFKLDSSTFVDKYLKYDEMIKFQHDIFNPELATKDMGITYLNLVIYTKQSFIFPTEVFFRLLQSSKEIPLIKLNPGKKQENIYRIFSPKISENGNKVPLLKKKRIIKIMNTCKKENTLYYVVDQVYKEKIIYIQVSEKPLGIKSYNKGDNNDVDIFNSLLLDNFQRNKILLGLVEADPEDIVIISDVDEIPNLENINFKSISKKFLFFKQDFFYYKFNLKHPTLRWFGSKATKKKNLKTIQFLRNLKNKIYPWWRLDILFSKKKSFSVKIVENGGWHFTNIKNANDMYKKMNYFAHHTEFEESKIGVNDIDNFITNGIVFYDH